MPAVMLFFVLCRRNPHLLFKAADEMAVGGKGKIAADFLGRKIPID